MGTMKKSTPILRSPGVIIVTFLMLTLIAYSASGAVLAIPQVGNLIFRMSDSWSIQITISGLLIISSVSFFASSAETVGGLVL
jgi:hypothetical protein